MPGSVDYFGDIFEVNVLISAHECDFLGTRCKHALAFGFEIVPV